MKQETPRSVDFEAYMAGWVSDDDIPPDARQYIETEEGQDFLNGGVYRHLPLTLQEYLDNPELGDVVGLMPLDEDELLATTEADIFVTPDEELTEDERKRRSLLLKDGKRPSVLTPALC